MEAICEVSKSKAVTVWLRSGYSFCLCGQSGCGLHVEAVEPGANDSREYTQGRRNDVGVPGKEDWAAAFLCICIFGRVEQVDRHCELDKS